MMLTDKTALVSFESSAKLVSGFSDDTDVLKDLVKPYNSGGTNARICEYSYWSIFSQIEQNNGDIVKTKKSYTKSNRIVLYTYNFKDDAENFKIDL